MKDGKTTSTSTAQLNYAHRNKHGEFKFHYFLLATVMEEDAKLMSSRDELGRLSLALSRFALLFVGAESV